MFKISPIQDKQLQKKYAEECGSKFCPDLFAYSMINQETGEFMGMSQFDIFGDCGYIHTLKTKTGYTDFEAMFILGRATMSFMNTCGVLFCRASRDCGEERLLKSIGFKLQENDEYLANMTGMFDGHCDGKSVDLNK